MLKCFGILFVGVDGGNANRLVALSAVILYLFYSRFYAALVALLQPELYGLNSGRVLASIATVRISEAMRTVHPQASTLALDGRSVPNRGCDRDRRPPALTRGSRSPKRLSPSLYSCCLQA